MLSIEDLALLMAKRGRGLQLGYSKAYSANRHEWVLNIRLGRPDIPALVRGFQMHMIDGEEGCSSSWRRFVGPMIDEWT